jgi:hypothetical protein
MNAASRRLAPYLANNILNGYPRPTRLDVDIFGATEMVADAPEVFVT